MHDRSRSFADAGLISSFELLFLVCSALLESVAWIEAKETVLLTSSSLLSFCVLLFFADKYNKCELNCDSLVLAEGINAFRRLGTSISYWLGRR